MFPRYRRGSDIGARFVQAGGGGFRSSIRWNPPRAQLHFSETINSARAASDGEAAYRGSGKPELRSVWMRALCCERHAQRQTLASANSGNRTENIAERGTGSFRWNEHKNLRTDEGTATSRV